MSWDNDRWRLVLGAMGDEVYIGHHVVFTSPERVRLGNRVRIDPFTYISGELETGDNVHICAHTTLGGSAGIYLADWTGVGYGSKLFSASEDYRHLLFECWGGTHVERAPIRLDRFATVASDVMVMPGVHFQEGTRVGAKSFVHRSPEKPWTIYVGNPLREFAAVDRESVLAEAGRIEAGRAA